MNFYEINVALNGHHFFATAPRSIVTLRELEAALPVFKRAFPEEDGFAITCTHWEKVGTEVSV